MTIPARLAALAETLALVEPGRDYPAIDYYDRRCIAAVEAGVAFIEAVTTVIGDDVIGGVDDAKWIDGVKEAYNRVLEKTFDLTR